MTVLRVRRCFHTSVFLTWSIANVVQACAGNLPAHPLSLSHFVCTQLDHVSWSSEEVLDAAVRRSASAVMARACSHGQRGTGFTGALAVHLGCGPLFFWPVQLQEPSNCCSGTPTAS